MQFQFVSMGMRHNPPPWSMQGFPLKRQASRR